MQRHAPPTRSITLHSIKSRRWRTMMCAFCLSLVACCLQATVTVTDRGGALARLRLPSSSPPPCDERGSQPLFRSAAEVLKKSGPLQTRRQGAGNGRSGGNLERLGLGGATNPQRARSRPTTPPSCILQRLDGVGRRRWRWQAAVAAAAVWGRTAGPTRTRMRCVHLPGRDALNLEDGQTPIDRPCMHIYIHVHIQPQ